MADNDCNQVCLPSSNSAFAVVHGIPGGLLSMAIHFAGRSSIIGIGLFAAGFRGKELLKGSMGGALVMEATLLAWAFAKKRSELKTIPVEDNREPGDGSWQALTIEQPAPPNPENTPKEPKPSLVDPNWDITTAQVQR